MLQQLYLVPTNIERHERAPAQSVTAVCVARPTLDEARNQSAALLVVLLAACTTAAACRHPRWLAIIDTGSADCSSARHIQSWPAVLNSRSSNCANSTARDTPLDSGVNHSAHSNPDTRGAKPPIKWLITKLHSSSGSRARQYTARQPLLLRTLQDSDTSPKAVLHKRKLLQPDDNTYGAATAARVIRAPMLPSHTVVHSFTPETAEAIAHSDSSGIHRLTAPPNRRNYATVEADPSTSNSCRRESIVRTRARSYIDNDPHNHNVDNVNPLRRRTFNYAKAPDKSTDGDLKYIAVTQSELPVLAVGGISFAQTYEGTTAAASSDSIALSSRGRLGTPQGTTIAAGSAVTWVGALVAANPHAKTSMAVSTAQRLGALAAAGVADGDMSLAQAESAASMAQTEALGWDELGEYAECPRCWHDPLSYSRQNKAAAPMPVLGHPQQPIPPGMAPYAPGMRRAGHESSSSSSAGTG